jgi:hypothetical protein
MMAKKSEGMLASIGAAIGSRASEPTLVERVVQLHADIDAALDQYVDEMAAGCQGVPRGVLRMSITNRTRCLCGVARILAAPE